MTSVATPPTGTPGTETRRWRLPVVIGAVLALALAVAVLGAGLVALDAGRDADAVQAAGLAAHSSGIPTELFDGLQNERNFGAAYLMGAEAVIRQPVASFGDATAATDTALADFRARLDDEGGTVARAFGPALDRIDGRLADLRATVTGYRGPRSLAESALSQQVFEGYSAQLDRLVTADRSIALAVDDSVLRRGVQLLDLGARQELLSSQLVRQVLLAGVTGDGLLGDPGEVGDTSKTLGTFQANAASITRLATGPFRPAAVSTAAPRARIAQLAELAARGETPLVAEATEIAGSTAGNPYATFRTGVSRVMDEHVARQVDAARHGQQTATSVAVWLGVAALGVAAVTIVVAVRRRPDA